MSLKIVVTRALPASQKGDLAIAQAQLAALRERFPGAMISLLCRRPERDARHFEQADEVLPELFAETGLPRPRRLLRLLRVLAGLGDDAGTRNFRKAIAGADLLLFCGGGSPGGYGLSNLVQHALCPVILAGRMGVPVAFTGLGVPAHGRAAHRWLHRRVLGQARLVAARDPLSYDELLELGLPGQAALTADWAWLLPAIPPDEAESLLAREGLGGQGRLRLGINLRSDRAMDPDGERAAAGQDRGRVICAALERVCKTLGAQVAVFSMNSKPASEDRAYARRVLDSLDPATRAKVHLLGGDYSPAQVKGMIASMDLFVGTRLHPSLFAVSSCVPTITVHDQSKVRGFMQHTNLLDWHLPATGLHTDQLVQRIVELEAQRGDIQCSLEHVVPEMERHARMNLQYIAALLELEREGHGV